MAYLLELNDSNRKVYIVTEGLTDVSDFSPIDITGSENAVTKRIDSNNDIFSPIIKQSVELELIRENDSHFQELLSANDNDVYCIIINNGGLYLDNGTLRLTAGATLDFIGILTLETYGEQYKTKSYIHFTFHDKMGFLDDDVFEVNAMRMNIPNFLATILPSIIISKYMLIQWDYSHNSINYPDYFYYDFVDFYGKKKKEVLEQFLTAHGLQIICDFSKNYDTNSTPAVIDCGCLMIRMANKVVNLTNSYYLYKREEQIIESKKIYSYTRQVESIDITTKIVNSEISLIYQYRESFIILLFGGNSYEIYFTSTEPESYIYWVDTSVYVTHSEMAVRMKELIPALQDYEDLSSPNIIKYRAINEGSQYNFTMAQSNSVFVYEIIDYSQNYQTITYDYLFDIPNNRNVVNDAGLPMINSSASWQLIMKARNIIITHNLKKSGNLLFMGDVNEDYILPGDLYSVYKYAKRLYQVPELVEENIISYMNNPQSKPNNLTQAMAGWYNGTPVIKIRAGDNVFFSPIVLYKDTYTLKFTFRGWSNMYNLEFYPLYIIKDNIGNLYYYNEWWRSFNSSTKFTTSIFHDWDKGENEFIDTIPITPALIGELYCFMIVNTDPFFSPILYISNAICEVMDDENDYPTGIKLTTMLNNLNRRDVELSVNFGCTPSIDKAAMVYKSVLTNSLMVGINTLVYDGSDQTLLAHLSDIYGYVYRQDRKMFNLDIKGNFDLYSPFEIDKKVFIFTSGSIDMQRNIISGSMSEVVYEPYADIWQWDDGSELQFDDLTRAEVG